MVAEMRHQDFAFVHLSHIANHYKMSVNDVALTLLTRQLMMVCVSTDFRKEGSPSGFVQLLKELNALELNLADRMIEASQKATSAISTAEALQEEATRLLAKLRKEAEERTK